MALAAWVERENARRAALTAEERERNYASHIYGEVDDCTRCIDCEIGIWNGEWELCPVYPRRA